MICFYSISTGSVKYDVQLTSSGHFEISENNILLVEGQLFEGASNLQLLNTHSSQKPLKSLCSHDIYQALRIRSYDYGPNFQGLESYDTESK